MADKTIRNPSTLEERVIDETAVPFFVNEQQPWVLLDSTGRKAANQTPATTADKDK